MFHKQHPEAGSRPGTLAPPADAEPTRIRVIEYGPGHWEDREIGDPAELERYRDSERVAWIDVQGLADTELLTRIGEIFSIHPLALEDAVNVPVRPKAEVCQSNHEVVTRMIRFGDERELIVEQVTLFVGDRWVLTIQERHGDVFDPVRKRTNGGPRFMRYGADYLGYALIDAVIDHYYPVVEVMGDELEDLEENVVEDPAHDVMGRIYRVRRNLVTLRRAIWPQREAVTSLLRDESPYFTDEVRRYLQDCYDHAVQLVEVVEGHRDLASGLMDLYMSSVSNRMNQIMQMLTIMASIFIPLTFIAGIYGMNFEHMPELHETWGYPLALAAMATIACGMLFFFWRRRWIGPGSG